MKISIQYYEKYEKPIFGKKWRFGYVLSDKENMAADIAAIREKGHQPMGWHDLETREYTRF